ncbi:hypothetical protein ABPG75_008368 [Micractinium tetrahymenae]
MPAACLPACRPRVFPRCKLFNKLLTCCLLLPVAGAAAGWVPAAPPAQPPPASARLPIAQHGGLPAASLHLSQLGSLHGALDPPHLAGTATGQLMASGGGGAMLAPAAEAALFMHSGCSSFTTGETSTAGAAARS